MMGRHESAEFKGAYDMTGVTSGALPGIPRRLNISTYSNVSGGSPVHTLYSNQVRGVTLKSGLVKTVPDVKGFRPPTSYIRFDCRVDDVGEGFEYSLKAYPNLTVARWGEVTPTNTSLGVGVNAPYHGTTILGGLRVPDVSSNLENRVRTELLNTVKDSPIHLGVFAAEFGKSLETIRDTALKIYEAYRAFRRGDFRRVLRVLGITSSRGNSQNWLSYQYGWMPLLQDAYGASELLTEPLRSQTGLFMSSRRINERYADLPKPTLYHKDWEHNGSWVVGCQGRVYYTVSDSLADLAKRSGLTNPLLIAWELMPFSFIIDWFLPIGSVLEALDATIGLKFKSGYITHYSKGSAVCSYYYVQSGHSLPEGKRHRIRISNQAMRRIPLVSWPKPNVYIRSPFSATRAISALALLRSARS